jgi:hypothetical protein
MIMTDNLTISRSAMGERPKFFPEEPAAERLLAIVTALVTEVAVLQERQSTLENLLEQKGVVAEADIEAYEPTLAVEEGRRVKRRAYLDRVFAVLQADIDVAKNKAG